MMPLNAKGFVNVTCYTVDGILSIILDPLYCVIALVT